MGGRFHTFRHPGAQHGLMHHASIDALQPIIPPTQHFLQETDLRAGKCEVRIPVRPRPDETLARCRQSIQETWNGTLVPTRPATDGVHRTLDRIVILAYRSMRPVRITSLVLQPRFEEQRYVLQALQPHRPPTIADKYWVGRE